MPAGLEFCRDYLSDLFCFMTNGTLWIWGRLRWRKYWGAWLDGAVALWHGYEADGMCALAGEGRGL